MEKEYLLHIGWTIVIRGNCCYRYHPFLTRLYRTKLLPPRALESGIDPTIDSP